MKCPNCNHELSYYWAPDEVEDFDEPLAYECGMTEDELLDAVIGDSDKWARFRYVTDQYECDHCGYREEGKRWYWNPATGYYNGAKPLTPKERAARERQRQEAAGQLTLPGMDGQL